MKQVLNFFPLVIFFIFYKIYDIYAASGALIVATGLALIITWITYRQVEKMTLITFVMVTFFGTLTLVFHNDMFIKWKVTVIYTLFAMVLLISQWVLKKPLIKKISETGITLPDNVWLRLNSAWAYFFLICGALNIYIAFWFPQETWVNFKVFGLTGLTLLFTLLCGVYVYYQLSQDGKLVKKIDS